LPLSNKQASVDEQLFVEDLFYVPSQ